VAVTHGRVAQLRNEGQEDEPLLDLVEDSRESVSSLVDLHVLESLHELLDLVLHFKGLGLLPSVAKVAIEDLGAGTDVVPEHLHVTAFVSDAVHLFVATINQVGVAELGGGVAEVLDLGLEVLDLGVDSVQLNEGVLTAAVVLVELALFELLGEHLHLFLELSNLVVVLLRLGADEGCDFLFDVLGELLEVGPVVKQLLGLLDLGILGGSFGDKEVKGLLKLVEGEHDLIALLVDLVDSIDN